MVNNPSTKTLPQGVRIRSGSIQIYFTRNNKTYNITLPHPPTAEGISTAYKIRSDLITKAEWNILTDTDIARAKGIEVTENTIIVSNKPLFQEVAQKYIKHSDANFQSRKSYANILNHHWLPDLALIPIQDITSELLKDLIIARKFKTNKTLNNCLIPLRGVFATAMRAKIITSNPMDDIANKKVQAKLPDPFTRDEMNTLLHWLNKNMQNENRVYYWYYELAFWTGCRPSELIALRWQDIDFFNNTIRITKNKVNGIEKQTTKTHTAREVYLNSRSKLALENLKELAKSNYVLTCPDTNQAFFNEKHLRLRLVKAMHECGIRHRPAYNARHTYATMLLMDGVNPVFVANQMGHSLEILMKRYAKWLHGDRNKQEIAKLNTCD